MSSDIVCSCSTQSCSMYTHYANWCKVDKGCVHSEAKPAVTAKRAGNHNTLVQHSKHSPEWHRGCLFLIHCCPAPMHTSIQVCEHVQAEQHKPLCMTTLHASQHSLDFKATTISWPLIDSRVLLLLPLNTQIRAASTTQWLLPTNAVMALQKHCRSMCFPPTKE